MSKLFRSSMRRLWYFELMLSDLMLVCLSAFCLRGINGLAILSVDIEVECSDGISLSNISIGLLIESVVITAEVIGLGEYAVIVEVNCERLLRRAFLLSWDSWLGLLPRGVAAVSVNDADFLPLKFKFGN